MLIVSCSKESKEEVVSSPFSNSDAESSRIEYELFSPSESEYEEVVQQIVKNHKLSTSNKKGLIDVLQIPLNQALYFLEEFVNYEYCQITPEDRFINYESRKSTFTLRANNIFDQIAFSSSELKKAVELITTEVESMVFPEGRRLVIADIEPLRVLDGEIEFEIEYLSGYLNNKLYEKEAVFNYGWRWGRITENGQGGGLCSRIKPNIYGFSGADAALTYFLEDHFRPKGGYFDLPECQRVRFYRTNVVSMSVNYLNSSDRKKYYKEIPCGSDQTTYLQTCSPFTDKYLYGVNLHKMCMSGDDLNACLEHTIKLITTETSIKDDRIKHPDSLGEGGFVDGVGNEVLKFNVNGIPGGSINNIDATMYLEVFLGERKCTRSIAPLFSRL